MTELTTRFLRHLLACTTQAEYERAAVLVVDEINILIENNVITKGQAELVLGELIKALYDQGFEKRGMALEQFGGLEDIYKSLSIDNSKSDELLANALKASPKKKGPKPK